jgi:hypothetical protein
VSELLSDFIEITDAFVDLFGSDDVAIGGGDDARLLLKCSAGCRVCRNGGGHGL